MAFPMFRLRETWVLAMVFASVIWLLDRGLLLDKRGSGDQAGPWTHSVRLSHLTELHRVRGACGWRGMKSRARPHGPSRKIPYFRGL